MKCMIVAYSKNRVIGKNGELPWRGKMPVDMRRFKELSVGKTIVMGRKTYDSIGRALPNRQNIVVSRGDFSAPEITTVHSLSEAYEKAEKEIAIIGGGQIYTAALDDTDVIYATEINVEIEGDAYFPVLGKDWHETSRESHLADENNAYPYSFVTYERV